MHGQQNTKKCIIVPDDNMEKIPFEKLTDFQLVKKFPALRGTHSLIILPTTQISAFDPYSPPQKKFYFLQFILILYFILRWDVPVTVFPSR